MAAKTEKLKAGDTVYALKSRMYGKEQYLDPLTVTKVGRVYFYVGLRKYKLETFAPAGGHGGQLYRSPKEWEEKKEKYRLVQEVTELSRKAWRLNGYALSLEELREVKDMLEEVISKYVK